MTRIRIDLETDYLLMDSPNISDIIKIHELHCCGHEHGAQQQQRQQDEQRKHIQSI